MLVSWKQQHRKWGWGGEGGGGGRVEGYARFGEILFFHRLLTFSVALVMSRRGRG